MANHFRLYSRPLMADVVDPALEVVGELEGYTIGEAYESRLDILNSIGKCRLEILESTLPNGAKVFVDNVLKQVVVKWPAFTPEQPDVHPIPNGSFEDQDDGSWLLEQGWTYGTGAQGHSVYDGSWSLQFGNFTGTTEIRSLPIRCAPGDNINVAMQVQQGASSPGNCGAAVFLRYRNTYLQEVGYAQGNMVNRGAKGAWHESRIFNTAPLDTAWVEAGARAYRSRQNKPMWVDYFTWDHRYTLGQDDDESYFLSIKVIDSLNRVAFWSGTIEQFSLFFTSTLYPIMATDSFSISSADPEGMTYTSAPAPEEEEFFGVSAMPQGMTFGIPTIPVEDLESFSMSAAPQAMTYRETLIPYTEQGDAIFELVSAVPQAMAYKTHPTYTTPPDDNLSISATPQGMTYG